MHITSIKYYYVLKVLNIIEIEESSVIKKTGCYFSSWQPSQEMSFPSPNQLLILLVVADHTTGNPIFVPLRLICLKS